MLEHEGSGQEQHALFKSEVFTSRVAREIVFFFFEKKKTLHPDTSVQLHDKKNTEETC